MPKASIGNYHSPFAMNLRALMDGNETGLILPGLRVKTSINQLAEAIGATRQAVSQYRNGTVAPNTEKLCSIADFFDVSTDFLLGRTTFPKGGSAELTTVEKTTGLTKQAITNLRNFAMNSPEQFDSAPWSKEPYAKATDYSVIADKFIGSEVFYVLIASISAYLKAKKNDNIENLKKLQDFHNLAQVILDDESVDCGVKEALRTFRDNSVRVEPVLPYIWEYRIQEIVKMIYSGIETGGAKG